MKRAVLILALASSSCTVGPNYTRPATVIAPRWSNAVTGASARPSGVAWWEAFGDSQLDRLEHAAQTANLSIEQALARIDQADAAAAAAGAALAPSGQVDASAARAQQSLNSGLGQLSRFVPGILRTVNRGQVSASASWDIDFAGGQKQRVLLARALYRQPRLLVMDEGTAHLDTEHERAVNDAVAAMGITRIIIAHRKETIDAADRVLVMRNGKLEEAPASV